MADVVKNEKSSTSDPEDSHETHPKEWDLYEKEKILLFHFFTKAETTLQSPPELVHNELDAQLICKELHSTLEELKEMHSSMTECNTKLRKKVRRSRKREQLEKEVTEFNQLFDTVEGQLNERLHYCEDTVARWSECYRRLHDFCDWLLETESKLTMTENSTLKTTETQVAQAKAFYNGIREKGVILANLEEDVKNLTSNNSSPHNHSPLTSNLTLVRQKWENLCSRSLAQSENLAHWQSYRKLKKQLVVWVLKTEKQLAKELAKSVEESDDLSASCELCQALLHEHEETRETLENLQRVAANFMDLPNVVDELEVMQNRWNSLGAALKDRLEDLQNISTMSLSPSNKLNNSAENADTYTAEEDISSDITLVNVKSVSGDAPVSEASEESAFELQPSHDNQQTLPEEKDAAAEKPNNDSVIQPQHPQKSVRAIFAEMTSNAARKEPARAVSLPERRQSILLRLKPVEERARRMQQCIIESSHAIYPHDMPDRIKTLQRMLAEYQQHKPATAALQQDLEDFSKACNDNDDDDDNVQKTSMDAHVKVLQRLEKIGDMLEARVDVCEKWEQHEKAQKELRDQLQSLQERLNVVNVATEEVAEVTSEVQGLRGRLKARHREAEGLDERMKATQVFLKDLATGSPLRLQSQLQELEQTCDRLERLAETKSQPQDRHTADITGSADIRPQESGGPVYKICLPHYWRGEGKEQDPTSSKGGAFVSDELQSNVEQATTISLSSAETNEEMQAKAPLPSQMEEVSSDTTPCSPPVVNDAGMAVNIAYAETVAITMSDARARFDWTDTSRDSSHQRAQEERQIQQIHKDIARLSQKMDTAATIRAESDAMLLSRIEELLEKRKRGEERLSKLTERENVVIYYLQPEEKHSDVLRRSSKVLKDALLTDLAQELYRRFNIRLLAISQDFVFFMDLPCSEALSLEENRPTVLRMIRNVLHEDFADITWYPPRVCSPWDIWKMAKRQQKIEKKQKDDEERKSKGETLEQTIARLGDLLQNEKQAAAEKEVKIREYQTKLEEDKEYEFTLERLTSLLEKDQQNNASKDTLIQELQGRLTDLKHTQTELKEEKQTVVDKDCLIRELHNRMSRDVSRLSRERDQERQRRDTETENFLHIIKDLSKKCARLEQQLEAERVKSQEAEKKLESERMKSTELESRLQQGPAGLR